MWQAAFAPFQPPRRADRPAQRNAPPAAGLPRVITLQRPIWRRAAASLRRWLGEQHERALAQQRCRELARLDAATLRDLGLGICARPDPLPDWVSYERARW